MKHKFTVQWVMSGDLTQEGGSREEAREHLMKLSLFELEQLGVCYLDDSLVIEESESLATDPQRPTRSR